MRRALVLIPLLVATALPAQQRPLDVLLLNGHVLDGAGNPWVRQDVGIVGDRIQFVGNARDARVTARDAIDATGLLVTPGFVDMHSHAELETPHGKAALSFLYQGITTVVIGVDGGGAANVRERFDGYLRTGMGVNALTYVGQGAARGAAMGAADRPPTQQEMAAMKAFIRRGMEEGAVGMSTGLFYVPGYYATTDEVVELNRVAAEYGGIYDTHDRDLGAAYRSIGFPASMREAIEIGERAGTSVIFSHLNPQGRHNYGKAAQAARIINEARARGVNVMAAQHPYTATQSSLSAYTIPRWASVGGQAAMRRRFEHPDTARMLDVQTLEMLDIRGGAEKILFVDRRPELNGKTLAQVAQGLGLPVPAAVRRVLAGGNASVMNLDLYDLENAKYLAQQDWMMTCTDGRTPPPGAEIVHPRPYGAFTRKLRLFALEDPVITLPFAVRSMTSLAWTFLGVPDRGLIKPGFYADIAVFDVARIRDRATYEEPHQYSEGTVHVLVNGRFAFRDGKPTAVLAGRPILRGGKMLPQP
ncbi:MAG: amidohydrolase family protein [Gemmatimonadetes bacterium]|nr:amidohydrolase family protein [Gemmatimonadota bacterium]